MAESIIVVKLGGTDGVDFSAICNDAVELLNRASALFLYTVVLLRRMRWAKAWHASEDDYLAFRIYVTLHRPQDAGNLFDGCERQSQFVVDRAVANAGSQRVWSVRTRWQTVASHAQRIRSEH